MFLQNIQQLVDACMTLKYDPTNTLQNLHLLMLHYTNQNEVCFCALATWKLHMLLYCCTGTFMTTVAGVSS